MTNPIIGQMILPGNAIGKVIKLDLPVSFWGGVDEHGQIIDVHHPQHGQSLTGKILVMESGRGSSSSSSVLAELIRSDQGPIGLVMAQADVIIALGAIVGSELYGKQIPIVSIDLDTLNSLQTDDQITVETQGDRGVITR